jgi:hypothetical protein
MVGSPFCCVLNWISKLSHSVLLPLHPVFTCFTPKCTSLVLGLSDWSEKQNHLPFWVASSGAGMAAHSSNSWISR